MRIVSTTDSGFDKAFSELLGRGAIDIESVESRVKAIINEVRESGDKAIIDQIARFDRWSPKSILDLIVTKDEMKKAWDSTSKELRESLELAYKRIESFHQKQMPKSWLDFEASGTMLGQKVTAVDRAGLYIPGGKAAYPSSLLMNAIPAIVAGVKEITVCVPAPDNELNSLVLAAAHLCGIETMYKVGGASAVAAMAYGTETIKKVDVITGPGNIYVATAKKLVFGEVNIDMIAGPSEIGVLADESAPSDLIAIDLLSQAEHDEMASSILITPSKKLAESVSSEVAKALKSLSRAEIATKSIESRGAIIVTKTMDEAVDLMNQIAPEHLEVMTANPHELLPYIKHAGAIFLGRYTPEAIGDYIAGPNHTLPTGGTARFFSPLGVENFLKKSSIISFSKAGFNEVADACVALANTEGLTAHGLSVSQRKNV